MQNHKQLNSNASQNCNIFFNFKLKDQSHLKIKFEVIANSFNDFQCSSLLYRLASTFFITRHRL